MEQNKISHSQFWKCDARVDKWEKLYLFFISYFVFVFFCIFLYFHDLVNLLPPSPICPFLLSSLACPFTLLLYYLSCLFSSLLFFSLHAVSHLLLFITFLSTSKNTLHTHVQLVECKNLPTWTCQSLIVAIAKGQVITFKNLFKGQDTTLNLHTHR